MDVEGPRKGARCADGRFAELCCADVALCTCQRLALYYGNGSTRPISVTLLVTLGHLTWRSLCAREGLQSFVASSAKLHGFRKWMPKALTTELGARTVALRSSVVPTWHSVPASGWRCRRQPAHCAPPSSSATPRCLKFTVLKAFTRWLACALLARAPFWTLGHGGTGLQFLNSVADNHNTLLPREAAPGHGPASQRTALPDG